MGLCPPERRSSVQYSLVCSASSEAKSSSGRNQGPASSPTTENPASANRHARVPPPAPVPTITKSTGVSSANSRIGTHAPGLKTSGARPLQPRGVTRGSSDTLISPLDAVRVMTMSLGCFPWVALVVTHPHVTAGACGAAPAHFAPGDRMGPVGPDDVREQTLLEKGLGRHGLPGLVM